MGKPDNPDTIILRNNYYPAGLTEEGIYGYYNREKYNILKETHGREVMFLIGTDVNRSVIKRKESGGFIKLTNQNYDKYITGRTVSVYSTMNPIEDIGIVDIDCNDLGKAKEAALDCYQYLSKNDIIKNCQIRFTGKTSFHVFCEFKQKQKIDNIRLLLRKELLSAPFIEKYTLQASRSSGIPNLDLSPNKKRGAFITLHALSKIGLRCTVVSPQKIKTFNPMEAKI